MSRRFYHVPSHGFPLPAPQATQLLYITNIGMEHREVEVQVEALIPKDETTSQFEFGVLNR